MANKKKSEVTIASEEEAIVTELKKVEKKIETVQNAEVRRKLLGRRYMNEEKVAVSISPMYRPYLGNTARVSVNGIMVVIPCNGKSYKVPKSHAEAVLGSIQQINERLIRKDKMKNIVNNVESSPGEIRFFK